MDFNTLWSKLNNFYMRVELADKAYVYKEHVYIIVGFGESFFGHHKYITLRRSYVCLEGFAHKDERVYEYQWDNVKMVEVKTK